MLKIAILVADSAVADSEALKSWYAEQGVPSIGDRLVEEVFARIESLSEPLKMGRIVREFEQPFLRDLIHPPFRIVYRRDPENDVRIVRIWRSEGPLALPED